MSITSLDLKGWIRDAAARLGFDLCGIAPASLPTHDPERYLWWLENDFHGEMKYMERRERQDIRLLLPSVRSVICVGMVYNS
ncbi:MAG: epoxyqueuosine reductase, partial [Acidobacteria bacterium]|nr:epoxyqueuosine reductase [Acidobacteriota bacterium]